MGAFSKIRGQGWGDSWGSGIFIGIISVSSILNNLKVRSHLVLGLKCCHVFAERKRGRLVGQKIVSVGSIRPLYPTPRKTTYWNAYRYKAASIYRWVLGFLVQLFESLKNYRFSFFKCLRIGEPLVLILWKLSASKNWWVLIISETSKNWWFLQENQWRMGGFNFLRIMVIYQNRCLIFEDYGHES